MEDKRELEKDEVLEEVKDEEIVEETADTAENIVKTYTDNKKIMTKIT